jgi:colanic acid/amylovoran biosynthesis glycosyltransferase
MEAMACGLPAVSTRLVGIPDLIENDVTGLLVEAGDVEALADALERLAGDRKLRTRLAEAGRSRVIETFDLDRCLEPLFQIFRGGRLRPDQASPRRAESRPLAAVGDSRS